MMTMIDKLTPDDLLDCCSLDGFIERELLSEDEHYLELLRAEYADYRAHHIAGARTFARIATAGRAFASVDLMHLWLVDQLARRYFTQPAPMNVLVLQEVALEIWSERQRGLVIV